MVYKKIPQCRICQSPDAATIDKDLFNRVSYQRIVENRGKLFSEDRPLTKACVYSHWKHVRKAVGETAAGLVPLPHGVLNPNLISATPAQQQLFEAMVTSELDEIATIQRLAKSGLKDLERLEEDADEETDQDLHKKLIRNKVRRDTTAIVSESAKVKKMALDVDEDRQRVEKGRIVFRMFEIMKLALDVVPKDIRSLVTDKLKDGIRLDEELRDLLRTQAEKGSAPRAIPITEAKIEEMQDEVKDAG